MQAEIPTTLGQGRFVVERRIGRGGMGVVYQAFDKEREMNVALKTLQSITSDNLHYFKREFRSLHDLMHPNLCSFIELINDNDLWFFTMELITGRDFLSSVENRCNKNKSHCLPFDEKRLRQSLAGLCHGLLALHSAGKVHRDIKPSNVMITDENRVVLLDFGLAVESGFLQQTERLNIAGSAAYMSPEQAQLESLGPAADLYAVGVMLYEAMTRKLPFNGPAMKIILDKQISEPTRAGELQPGLPEDLEMLCMDLLSKVPDRRPDTLRILSIAEEKSQLISCDISTTSLNAHYHDELFVGRTSELNFLREAFSENHVQKSLGIFIVEGISGVGKSSLATRFFRDLTIINADTLILKGRCYERESAPFKAFDGVVESLVTELRQNPPQKAEELLPRHADLLVELFPTLQRAELFADIHKSRVEIQDAHELQKRTFDALKQLLYRFCERKPLVVVIDDMQWTDADSLLLLRNLISEPAPPLFLLLLSRRTHDGKHSVWDWNKVISPNHERLKLRTLDAIDSEELARLAIHGVNSSFDLDAKSIASEAGGHPHYIAELVQHIAYGGKNWQNARIDEVIWQRVQIMPVNAQRLLRYICVAGTPMQMKHLRKLTGMDSKEFFNTVGLLRASKLLLSRGPKMVDLIEPYHDRVREAIVAHGLSGSETVNIQLNIGRFLLNEYSDEEINENIFTIVRYLHDGVDLISDNEERQHLAELLYMAGKKALATAAFASSLVYFEESIALLAPDAWEKRYDMVYDLYCAAAEAAFVSGKFDLTKSLVVYAKTKARSVLDTAKIYETYVLSLAADNKPYEAIDETINMIRKLGITVPRRPGPVYLLWKLAATKLRLLFKTKESLLELQMLNDNNIIAAFRMFNRVSQTVFITMPILRVILAIRMLELAIKHGVDRNLVSAFSFWGYIISTLLGSHRAGYNFGRLSLDLINRFRKLKGNLTNHIAVFTHATFLQHLRQPIRDTLPLLLESYDLAYKTGDLPYLGWSGTVYCLHSFFAGLYLPDETVKYTNYISEISNKGQDIQYNSNCLVYQTALNFLETSSDATLLNGRAYNEEEMVPQHLEKNQRNNFSSYLFFKMMLQVFFGDYKNAYGSALQLDGHDDTIKGTFRSRITPCYDSCACLKYYENADGRTKKKIMQRVLKSQKKYKKMTQISPKNHLHKYTLVEAEKARLKGVIAKAAILYDEAIHGASQYEFYQDAALACEFAADFYREIGDEEKTLSYARDALGHYEKWGAFAKVEHVKEKFGIK